MTTLVLLMFFLLVSCVSPLVLQKIFEYSQKSRGMLVEEIALFKCGQYLNKHYSFLKIAEYSFADDLLFFVVTLRSQLFTSKRLIRVIQNRKLHII